MGKKNQGKKRMQPDAADVATPVPKSARAKLLAGSWRETAWDKDGGSYCHSDTLDCK